MKFTFKMYDFDNNGKISPEDVRIILSYVPFKRQDDGTPGSSVTPDSRSRLEGRFAGENLTFDQRQDDQE